MDSIRRSVSSLDYSQRVLAEMSELLERVRQSTVDVVEHTGDQPAMAQLLECVQQSHNTFRLIECFGAELLTSELLLLLQAIQQKKVDEKIDPSTVLVLASEKLNEYIEYLKSGGQDLPLALLSLVNNMRACRGVGLLSEALIVSPHFQIPEVAGHEQVEASAEKEFFNVVRRSRLPLMRDLVRWFRQPDKKNMQPLTVAFASLQIASPTVEFSNLWAAARALGVSLADGGLESSAAVKMLLGQLERYIQRLDQQASLESAPAYPVNLFKNLLYYVALSGSSETAVLELKKQFRLSELLPPRSSLEVARGALGGPSARLSEAICNSLAQELGEAKLALDTVSAQSTVDSGAIDDALHRLRQVSYTLLLLGLNHARLLNDRAVQNLAQCRERDDYSELQGIAADILRVDAALEEYLHGNGRPAVFADDFKAKATGSEKLSSYQFNLIVEQCLGEAVRSLHTVQSAYLSALTDESRCTQLGDCASTLDAVAHALQILPLPELKPLLGGAALYLRRVAAGEAGLSDPEQQRFADVMVCSELYLDSALQRQAAAADLLMHADESLNLLLEDMGEQDKASVLQSPELVTVSSAERDMMSIFIDEALDSFSVINQQMAAWKTDRDPEALNRVCRQYHKIKGSGMVAGAATIAEFGAVNEEMLEQYIRHGNPITEYSTTDADSVENLLQESAAVLPQLINQLSNPAQAGLIEIEGLQNLLNRIRQASTLASSANAVGTADFTSTSAIDIFDQTIATNMTVDEMSQTLSLHADAEADMTSTVSMHDLGDNEHTRTLALTLSANDTAAASDGTNAGSAVTDGDNDFTRTISMSEQSELTSTEFTQTVALQSTAPSTAETSDATGATNTPLADDATQVLGSVESEDTAGYSLDNTLLRVFYTECLSHVALLKDLLSPSISDVTVLPSPEMQRSLHTVRGSAHTADVPSVARLVGPLEDIANSKLGKGQHFTREEVALVKDVVHALELQVDALSEGRPVPPVVAEAEARLHDYMRQSRHDMTGNGASGDLQELYIEEASELLGNIHTALSEMRDVADQQAQLNRLQADLHTLKGGARVAQFNAIADITHALEGALTRWVSDLPLSTQRQDKLQEVADAITVNLEQARTGRSLGQFDWLISELGCDDAEPADDLDSTSADGVFELTQLIPTPYTQPPHRH